MHQSNNLQVMLCLIRWHYVWSFHCFWSTLNTCSYEVNVLEFMFSIRLPTEMSATNKWIQQVAVSCADSLINQLWIFKWYRNNMPHRIVNGEKCFYCCVSSLLVFSPPVVCGCSFPITPHLPEHLSPINPHQPPYIFSGPPVSLHQIVYPVTGVTTLWPLSIVSWVTLLV